MRGKENVLSEVNIMMMIYNLRQLITILGIKTLKHRLKSLVNIILSNYELIIAILRNCFFIINPFELKYLVN